MRFFVNGGKKLAGEIILGGAKAVAPKLMIASFLTDEPCYLENFPEIGETQITQELCESVGSHCELKSDCLKIQTPVIKNHRVISLSRRNRIPILALGPLLARAGEAEVPVLGGDQIGPRPVDIHLEALTALGAEIQNNDKTFYAKTKNGLKGAKIVLRYPSVGATENAILAAVLARGRTIVYNAAVEPEITDLIKMLQKMGAIIGLGANRAIHIDGVKKLRGARHRIMPDRNEAVSFACLAIATNGKILVKEARQEDLLTFLNALRRIGGEYEIVKGGIEFSRPRSQLTGIELETDTHPGFMTDWQQPFTILLTQASGTSVIHETVYEDRFAYTEDLNRMGANIQVFSKCLGELPCRFNGGGHYHSAVIHGPTRLQAIKTAVRDLRAGMAHLIAALVANGRSEISGIEEIDRGYYKIDERLRGLGADIKRAGQTNAS